MKNILVTVNIGGRALKPRSRDSLKAAAERWSAEYIEITQPIQKGYHHFWQKALVPTMLPDDSRVFQIDADTLIRQDSPSPFAIVPVGNFACVACNPPFHRDGDAFPMSPLERTYLSNRQTCADFWAAKTGMKTVDAFDRYFNAGLMMYDLPAHRELFTETFELGRLNNFSKGQMPEQSILTLLLQHKNVPTTWLPWIWNTCGLRASRLANKRKGMNTFMYHFTNGDKAIFNRIWWRCGDANRAQQVANCFDEKAAPLVGAEIGVFRGYMSAMLLSYLPNLHLHMVDKWSEEPQGTLYRKTGDANSKWSQSQFDALHDLAKASTDFADHRRTINRKASLEAVKDIADGSLDFAFIDADHSYEGCLKDMRAWLPKIKPTGWLCGHDYRPDVTQKNFGVNRAVAKFSEETGREIIAGPDVTWWLKV